MRGVRYQSTGLAAETEKKKDIKKETRLGRDALE